LMKIDGKWLVHVTKEDIASKDMNMASDEEEGMMMDPDSVEALLLDTLTSIPPAD